MNRTTKTQLQALVDRLNREAGTNPISYCRKDGQTIANIGNYHLDWSYGGVSVVQMVNHAGGVRHALGMYGSATKADCERHLRAALWMLEEAKQASFERKTEQLAQAQGIAPC